MTMLEENSIAAFDDTSKTIALLTKNDTAMIWPSQLGFDHKGNLLFVSNKRHYWVQDMLTWDKQSTNFRIWSVPIGGGSYLDPIPGPDYTSFDATSYILIGCSAIAAVIAGCGVGYCQRNKKKPQHQGLGSVNSGNSINSALPYNEVNEVNEEEGTLTSGDM